MDIGQGLGIIEPHEQGPDKARSHGHSDAVYVLDVKLGP